LDPSDGIFQSKVRIAMPSDVTNVLSRAIKMNPQLSIGEQHKRIKVIESIAADHDRAVRREMLHLNNQIDSSDAEHFMDPNRTAGATCTGYPDINQRCSSLHGPGDMNESFNPSSLYTRRKRSLGSTGLRFVKWLGKRGHKMQTAFKNHPWKSLGKTLALSLGLYGTYEIADTWWFWKLPVNVDLDNLMVDLTSRDKLVVDITDHLFIANTLLSDSIRNTRIDLREAYNSAFTWTDQLIAITSAITLLTTRTLQGLHNIAVGKTAYPIVPNDVIYMLCQLINPTQDFVQTPFSIKGLFFNISSNTIWLGVRTPPPFLAYKGTTKVYEYESTVVEKPDGSVCKYSTPAVTFVELSNGNIYQLDGNKCMEWTKGTICPSNSLLSARHPVHQFKYCTRPRQKRDLHNVEELLDQIHVKHELILTPVSETDQLKGVLSQVKTENRDLVNISQKTRDELITILRKLEKSNEETWLPSVHRWIVTTLLILLIIVTGLISIKLILREKYEASL
jgi:hypothetical protein